MESALTGAAARIAGGFAIVACAAVVVFAVGGSTLFGGLGSLFGNDGASLQVAQAPAAAADIVAAPTAAERSALAGGPARSPGDGARTNPGVRTRGRSGQPGSSTPVPNPAPAPGPLQPAPSLPVPPPAAPAPQPGGGQVAGTLSETVKQLLHEAPSQLQPVTAPVATAVDGIVQTCTSVPVCP